MGERIDILQGAAGPLIQNLERKIGKALTPLIKVTDNMSKNKFIRSTQKLMNTFKSMGKASLKANVMEKLMTLLNPVLKLFDMFSPIFELLGAIIQAFFLPLMEALAPVIKQVVEWLKPLIPIMKKVGEIFFWALGVALEFLYQFVLRPIYYFLKYSFIVIWEVILTIGRAVANIFIGIYNALVFVWNGLIGVVNWVVRYIGFGWAWGFEDLPTAQYADYVDVVNEDRWSEILSGMQEEANDMIQDQVDLLERIAEAIERGLL